MKYGNEIQGDMRQLGLDEERTEATDIIRVANPNRDLGDDDFENVSIENATVSIDLF